jgi:hypothetical protein
VYAVIRADHVSNAPGPTHRAELEIAAKVALSEAFHDGRFDASDIPPEAGPPGALLFAPGIEATLFGSDYTEEVSIVLAHELAHVVYGK